MSKNSVYVSALKSVLTELGGGPLRSGDVVEAVKERGLVPDGKYTYNYILNAARGNPDLFDTGKRGWIALASSGAEVETDTGAAAAS